MKRTSKVISLILSVFMLMQMMTGAVFAKIDASKLTQVPEKLSWSVESLPSKNSAGEWEYTDEICYKYERVPNAEVYLVEFYKNGKLVDNTADEINPEYEDYEIGDIMTFTAFGTPEYGQTDKKDIFTENGIGKYTFRVAVCSDTYTEFYEHWDPDRVNPVKWSAMSPEFDYTGEIPSNVFNVTLPDVAFDMNAENKDYEIKDIYKDFPENMRGAIVYASGYYTDYITENTVYTYTNKKTGAVSKVEAESSVINCILQIDGVPCENYYNLGIKVPENLESGAYKLEIDLPVADGKECDDVKPFHVTINNFAYYNNPSFDFTGITKYLERGERTPMTKNTSVTVKFNQNAMDCFDKFYLAIPSRTEDTKYVEYKLDKDTMELPLLKEDGLQDLTLIFGTDDYETGCEVSKEIILYNTITFMADGKVAGTYDLDVGEILSEEDLKALIESGAINPPEKEGYVITGWEGLPDRGMPAEPVTVTAVYEVEPPLKEGKIGTDGKISWSYYKDGTLYIKGEGALTVPEGTDTDEYLTYLSTSLGDNEYIRTSAKKIVIGEGITEICSDAFYEFYFVEKITLPSTLKKIGGGFMKGSSVTDVVIPASVDTFNMNWSFIKCPSELKVTFLNKNIKLTNELTAGNSTDLPSGLNLYGYTGSDVETYANSDEHKCNFVSIDPDFVINDGAESTNSKNVKITLNKYALENFKQYKLGDGFKDVSENIDYVLDSKDGEQTITIVFKNDDCEIEKTHTIVFDNKHKITYVSDGKTVGEETVGCGAKIEPKVETPVKDGSVFVKWDIPEIMPDNDITATAIFAKTASDESLKSLLTEEEIASGVTVKSEVKAADENENIELAIANKYSKYTASIMLDINIVKEKDGSETGKITETPELLSFSVDIPENVQGKTEYIVLREHNGEVDALTTRANSDGEYIEVKGNTLTIYAKKFSAYALIATDRRNDNPPRKGSSSGSASSNFNIKFESNGGSAVKAITTTKNTKITEPEAPVKEGFVFDGWYTDSAFKTKFDFATPVTGAMTLYAKWIE